MSEPDFDYCNECGETVWENEDGICHHAACTGDHPDCGKLIAGTIVQPEDCPLNKEPA